MTQAKSSPPSSFAAAATGVSQLWRWWSGELKAMLPASIVRGLDGDAVATNVAVDGNALTIITTSAGAAKSSPPQHVPLDALLSSPVLRNLIAAGRDQVRLVLAPEQALVKQITLPLATEENLREVVGFELDRHTPFTPDQAYYDVQVVRRDPKNEKIAVSLAVASRSEITALVDTLRRAGLTCTAIGINASAATNAAAFDLQPAFDKPPRRLSRMHRINLGLLAVAGALLFAAVILPIWQKREAVKLLNPQAQKSGAEFQLSERVYSQYTRLVAEYNFLATRKHAVYPVVSVLEELARTFLDTTWIQKLDIKQNGKVREVTMLGETQSVSKVIENLEQSPQAMFQNSKQLTQTTPVQSNTVRFHVSAEIKPRPVPAAESIDAVAVSTITLTPAPTLAAPVLPAVTVPTIPVATVVTPAPAAGTTPMQPMPTGPTAGKGAVAVPVAPAASPTTPLSTFNGPPATSAPPAKSAPPPTATPTAPAGKGNGT